MYSMIPILIAVALSTLSIFVRFKADKNKRKRIEQALEIPAGAVFIVGLFYTVANFRELNKIALTVALIILLFPFFLYPFSAVLKDP